MSSKKYTDLRINSETFNQPVDLSAFPAACTVENRYTYPNGTHQNVVVEVEEDDRGYRYDVFIGVEVKKG